MSGIPGGPRWRGLPIERSPGSERENAARPPRYSGFDASISRVLLTIARVGQEAPSGRIELAETYRAMSTSSSGWLAGRKALRAVHLERSICAECEVEGVEPRLFFSVCLPPLSSLSFGVVNIHRRELEILYKCSARKNKKPPMLALGVVRSRRSRRCLHFPVVEIRRIPA